MTLIIHKVKTKRTQTKDCRYFLSNGYGTRRKTYRAHEGGLLDSGLVPALARASDLRVAQLTRPACELVRVLPPRGDKGLARPIMLPQRADSRLRNHPLALTRALTLALTRPSASCSPSSSPLKHISLTPGVCLRLVERRRARGVLASHPAPERLPRRRGGKLEAGATRAGGRAWEGTLLEGLD